LLTLVCSALIVQYTCAARAGNVQEVMDEVMQEVIDESDRQVVQEVVDESDSKEPVQGDARKEVCEALHTFLSKKPTLPTYRRVVEQWRSGDWKPSNSLVTVKGWQPWVLQVGHFEKSRDGSRTISWTPRLTGSCTWEAPSLPMMSGTPNLQISIEDSEGSSVIALLAKQTFETAQDLKKGLYAFQSGTVRNQWNKALETTGDEWHNTKAKQIFPNLQSRFSPISNFSQPGDKFGFGFYGTCEGGEIKKFTIMATAQSGTTNKLMSRNAACWPDEPCPEFQSMN